jgi:hypothetical protein
MDARRSGSWALPTRGGPDCVGSLCALPLSHTHDLVLTPILKPGR